jgi:hypothetical protein
VSGPLPGDGDGVLSPVEDPGDSALVPVLMGRMGTVDYDVTLVLWGRDGLDNNSDGRTDDQLESAYVTVTGRATAGDQTRLVETVLGRSTGGVFWNAVYAGNSSADPSYDVTFKGTGRSADTIQGDIYINGDINVQQQAAHSGNVMLTGTLTGPWTYANGIQPMFDLAAMNYPANNDVNVANELSGRDAFYGPSYGGNDLGGSAWQLPQSNPAHIFRKNPSDRTDVYSAYDNVYALEDPGERLQADTNWNGTDATKISFTNGYEYNKVYYVGPKTPGENVAVIIDNTSTYSYKFNTPGAEATGQQVVIAVKGDMYIGDNIFYTNQNKDAVVFIALKNDDGTGGNIFFGDSRYGTVEDFNAYMFAENNFQSTNVSYSASKILVRGNMTAGNQVRMNLDVGRTHHKWEVVFDDRLKQTLEGTAQGARRLDGLVGIVPPNPGGQAMGSFLARSWRQLTPRSRPMLTGYQF